MWFKRKKRTDWQEKSDLELLENLEEISEMNFTDGQNLVKEVLIRLMKTKIIKNRIINDDWVVTIEINNDEMD